MGTKRSQWLQCAVLGASIVALLTACQAGLGRLTLAEQVRGVGTDTQTGLQIYGLRNPIVTDMMGKAMVAEKRRDFDQALRLLDRALVIEPNAPDILQQVAEVQLEQGRWTDAITNITKSIELGPRLGHLCKRNWRGLVVAYQNLGQWDQVGRAEARIPLCERTRPDRF